ncbi:MAG: ABC transporter permease, partial [Dehalococcoidia bacterium]
MSATSQSLTEAAPIEATSLIQRPNRWRKALRLLRTQPLGAASLVVIVLLVLTAVFAEVIAPYDPTSTEFRSLQSPNGTNLFGTDDKGRDVFSRVIYGSRTSLKVGIIATAIGVIGGALVGLISGYFGGWADTIIQRMVDTMMAFPTLILALIMIAVLGTSIVNLMIVVGIAIIPGVGRVIRGVVLSEKQNQYVEATRAVGAGSARGVVRHILPNIMAPLIVIATSLLAGAILIEAGLSFLGLGTPPPTPSWGADLSG